MRFESKPPPTSWRAEWCKLGWLGNSAWVVDWRDWEKFIINYYLLFFAREISLSHNSLRFLQHQFTHPSCYSFWLHKPAYSLREFVSSSCTFYLYCLLLSVRSVYFNLGSAEFQGSTKGGWDSPRLEVNKRKNRKNKNSS